MECNVNSVPSLDSPPRGNLSILTAAAPAVTFPPMVKQRGRSNSSPARRSSDRHYRQVISGRRSLTGVTVRLLELGEQLRRARALEETLQAVTRIAVELTRSAQGTLRLLDESGKRLLTSARHGPSVHRRGAPPFRYGEGFIGWVVAHRRPAYTNNPGKDPRFVVRAGQVWTPGAVMAVPLLGGSDCIGVLSVSRRRQHSYGPLDLNLLRLIGQLSEPQLEIARLKHLGESDPLTLLHNRRHLDQRLPLEIQRARRSRKALSVIMLDIDHFKRINDSYGHDAGDAVLCEFADRLRRCSRTGDVLVRWGGEEFVAVLLDSDLKQARQIAERILAAVGQAPFACPAGMLSLTTSAGVVSLGDGDDSTRLLRRADQALYRAKNKGRNRVVVAK